MSRRKLLLSSIRKTFNAKSYVKFKPSGLRINFYVTPFFFFFHFISLIHSVCCYYALCQTCIWRLVNFVSNDEASIYQLPTQFTNIFYIRQIINIIKCQRIICRTICTILCLLTYRRHGKKNCLSLYLT